MTAPRPPLGPPLGPACIAELLDDAVRHVIASADALDRIRRGVRRRRAAHRAGTALLAVAVLAGGASAALAVTSGRTPSVRPTPSATATPSPSSRSTPAAAPSTGR
jgi:hypothetical protein